MQFTPQQATITNLISIKKIKSTILEGENYEKLRENLQNNNTIDEGSKFILNDEGLVLFKNKTCIMNYVI